MLNEACDQVNLIYTINVHRPVIGKENIVNHLLPNKATYWGYRKIFKIKL